MVSRILCPGFGWTYSVESKFYQSKCAGDRIAVGKEKISKSGAGKLFIWITFAERLTFSFGESLVKISLTAGVPNFERSMYHTLDNLGNS